MHDIALDPGRTPDFDAYLDRWSALELARRSLVGAPVYTVISLIMLIGTPILANYGWWAIAEAGLLLALGGIRVFFALGFERRYDKAGERAVVHFSILTALQSLTLGVLAGMVIWEYWPAQEVVLTIVLSAGCIAAGTSALSVRRSAHFIFLICVLMPLGISVYLVGGATKSLLILGFLFLMGFLVQDGGRAKHTYIERLKDHYDDQMNLRRTAVESQAKKEFLAEIGHKIRTPVSSIIGMADLLLDENLNKRSRDFTGIIRKSSDALIDLVDNIPGSVNSGARRQDNLVASINLRKCVRKVMELYRFVASGKKLALSANLDDLPQSILFGEEGHLKEVLANLLSNAVENTEHGAVKVEASCQSIADGALTIEFCVLDTGCGIPAGQLDSIFDPFDTSGATISGKYDGGGLGLPLCKGLVELMGGEIWINSVEGQGTSANFTIRAQLDPTDTSWPPGMEADVLTGAGASRALGEYHPHKIMVVDDVKVHRQILCAQLGKMGYKANQATDGQEAVVEAINGKFDLIFMDLYMPTMGGIEASKWIREHLGFDNSPRIIAVTGDASSETRKECTRAGIDEFVTKPVTVKTLENILQSTA